MPPSLVYAAGYKGRKPETLYQAAIVLGATVLDIRPAFKDRFQPEWNGAALTALLGDYYRTCAAWGDVSPDPKYGQQIRNFDSGMAEFEQLGGPVILLCRCANYHKCHRSAVARLIEPRGYKVVFFDWDHFEGGEPSLF